MKKFIYKILAFLLPIIFLAYLSDFIISKKIRASGAGDFSVWEDIYNGRINSDIVIYGSSRALNHINPVILEDEFHTTAYNLGMAGQHIWLQNLRHIEFLKYNKKPKVVIYSLDDLLFSDPIGIYQPDQFSPYMFWPKHKEIEEQLSVYKFPHFSYFDYKIPLLRYVDSFYSNKALELGRIKFLSFIQNISQQKFENSDSLNKEISRIINHENIIKPEKRIKGYLPRDLNWNSDFDNALFSKGHLEVSINKKGIHLFEKILTELIQKNIYVLFVYTPEYIEGQKFIKNRAEVMEIYTNISKKYNIPFINYSNDTMSYQKKYFFNSLHLNANGAEKFSKKFALDIKPILYRIIDKF